MEKLITAKPVERDAGNIVMRAVRAIGPDASAAKLAAAINKESQGRSPKVTRQMVNGWMVRNQFPLEMCMWVHLVTKIPVKLLVKRRTEEH
jgi:hypothetical protein